MTENKDFKPIKEIYVRPSEIVRGNTEYMVFSAKPAAKYLFSLNTAVTAEAKEIAEQIQKCVNTHELLIETLEVIVDVYKDQLHPILYSIITGLIERGKKTS